MEENKVIDQEVLEEVENVIPKGNGIKNVAVGAAIGAGVILGGFLAKKAAKPVAEFIKDKNPFAKKVHHLEKTEEIINNVEQVVEETA